MGFIEANIQSIISTIIVTLFVLALRYLLNSLIKKSAKYSEILENRMNLVIKYVSILLTGIYLLVIAIIWGVNKEDLFITISSVVTVIGVAFFAQWSILSNMTSGIILLFSFPFKIGDMVKILDKDYPITGEIIDIRTFYTLIKTADGETITYPNSLMLQKGISFIERK